MNLLNFIELEIEKLSAARSVSSRDKDAACVAALRAYLGDSDMDLRRAVFFDFLYRFGKFLTTGYEKRYSSSTNREILRSLRKWIRQAIIQGLVPNIDVVPAVIERLEREFPDEGEETNKKKAMAVRPDLKVREAVGSMMRVIESWTIRQRMGSGSKPADKEGRARELQNHCAAVYLFCLLTYGLEIRDALAIKCERNCAEIPDEVYVEKYGTALALNRAAKNLVKYYNEGVPCTEHLFNTLDNKKYKGEPEQASRMIGEQVTQYVRREHLPLYKRKCLFIDWLNYAIESGLPDDDAETLWHYFLGDVEATAVLPEIDKAQSTFGSSSTALEETWYLLSVIPLSVKRNRFLQMFLSSGIIGKKEEACKRVYAPEEKFRNKERGEFAVFSRYIFFRATPLQAEFANSFSPHAYVLKDKGNRRFARIRKAEIEHLREMLRDFPDVVEMKDGREWLEAHNAEIMVGCKAIIRSGSLAGKEATVVHVKGKKKDELTFFLEFVEGAIKFQTNLEGVQLDIVET